MNTDRRTADYTLYLCICRSTNCSRHDKIRTSKDVLSRNTRVLWLRTFELSVSSQELAFVYVLLSYPMLFERSTKSINRNWKCFVCLYKDGSIRLATLENQSLTCQSIITSFDMFENLQFPLHLVTKRSILIVTQNSTMLRE